MVTQFRLKAGLCMALGFSLFVSASVLATDLTPRQRRDLELLATGRARLALAEEIQRQCNLHSGGEGWPRELELRLRNWLRDTAEIRPVRLYSDGVTEADASIPVEDLLAWLQSAEQAGRMRTRDEILWGSGDAQAEELPNDQRPLGWRHYTAETVERLRREAEKRAVAELMARFGHRLEPQGGESAAPLISDPELLTALTRVLRRDGRLNTMVDADLLVIGEVEITAGRLKALLAGLDQNSDALLPVLDSLNDSRTLKAEGETAPVEADRLAGGGVQMSELDPPDWARRTLRVRGVSIDASLTLDERISQAQLNALETLRNELLDLEIRSGVVIGRYLERVPKAKPDVVRLLSSGQIVRMGPHGTQGQVVCEMTLPLGRLWELMKSTMREVRGAESAVQR